MSKMKGRSVFKIPDGKLVKISLEYEENTGRINTIKIMGDFFIHPEESIEKLEETLAGSALEEVSLSEKIRNFLDETSVEVFGITPDGLAKAIVMCKDENIQTA